MSIIRLCSIIRFLFYIIVRLCNQVNEDVKNSDLYDECSHCEEFCTPSRGARACSSCAHLFCASCISSLKFCSLCGEEFFTNTNQCSNAAASPPAPPEHNVSAKANARIKSERCDEKAEAEAPLYSTFTQLEAVKPPRESQGRPCNFPGCPFVASSRAAAVEHMNERHMECLLCTHFNNPSTTFPGIYVFWFSAIYLMI